MDEVVLREQIYPDTEHTLYWSERWDPDFYVALARAGFICISAHHPRYGPVLVPELQESYAVLDWEDLHCSRKLAKLLRSGRLEDEGVELVVADSCDRVIEGLLAHHGADCWLHAPYRKLMRQLAASGSPDLTLQGVELWSRRRGELLAGELGYTIGRTYTSLSGFCRRGDPRWRHSGTLQQFWLAGRLQERGYAFWNMGHPSPPYKRALGARIVPRAEFLERWLSARDASRTSATS